MYHSKYMEYLFGSSKDGDLYQLGECPGCKYWPTVLQPHLHAKACIFDSVGNPRYKSSVKLANEWQSLGNRAETYFSKGDDGCRAPPLELLDCLNDDRQTLLRGVRIQLLLRTETPTTFDRLQRRPKLRAALSDLLSNGIRLNDCEFRSRSAAKHGGLEVHYTIHFRRSSVENVADVVRDLIRSRTFNAGLAANLQQQGWKVQAKDIQVTELNQPPVSHGVPPSVTLIIAAVFGAGLAITTLLIGLVKLRSYASAMRAGGIATRTEEYGGHSSTHFGGAQGAHGYNAIEQVSRLLPVLICPQFSWCASLAFDG